jgi:hypothetical protein
LRLEGPAVIDGEMLPPTDDHPLLVTATEPLVFLR